jgi:hypothetical protein
MEKSLIKKDALAGIAKKMAGDFLVWAPVKKEDNILFEPLQKERAEECFLPTHGNHDEIYSHPEGYGFFG